MENNNIEELKNRLNNLIAKCDDLNTELKEVIDALDSEKNTQNPLNTLDK